MLLFENGGVTEIVRRQGKGDGKSFGRWTEEMGRFSALPNIRSPYHCRACPTHKISAYKPEEGTLNENLTNRSFFIEIVIG